MEVLDNLSDTASIAAISKAITQPSEPPRLSRLITLIIELCSTRNNALWPTLELKLRFC